MTNIDPQVIQQMTQLLATYGTPAGIAAAQFIGTSAAQTLGSDATKAMKSLWGRIQHKSKQEGSIAEEAVTAFESNPDDPEHQHTLSFFIKHFCNNDPAFTQEITELFKQVKHDPSAAQFIQHISHIAQLGAGGHNFGTINQTYGSTNLAEPDYELKVELSEGFIGRQGLTFYPTLCVTVLNTGKKTSYISSIRFDVDINGKVKFFQMPLYNVSQIANRFGEPLPPGRSHIFNYIKRDLSQVVEKGQKVTFHAVVVRDEIGHSYQKEFTPEMAQAIINEYTPGYSNFQ